jgi:hypothetical protein
MFKDALVKFLKLEGLIEGLTGYIETRVELLKLEVKEDFARSMARVMVILVIAFALTFFILFMSFAIAYRLGESLGMFGGFSVVAGFYVIIVLVLILFRKSIIEMVEKKLVGIIKEKKE